MKGISPAITAGLLFTPAPDQSAALAKASDTTRAWISGEDLTKRMQVLVAMCWNALLKGETSLICVSPDLRNKVVEALKIGGMQSMFFDLSGQVD